MSPEEYDASKADTTKAREHAERDLQTKESRVLRAMDAFEAAEDAETAARERYNEIKRKNGDPAAEQQAWQEFNEAQKARAKAGDDLKAAEKLRSIGEDWLKKMQSQEARFQAPGDREATVRVWEAYDRLRHAEHDWNEWQRNHPGDHSSAEHNDLLKKYGDATLNYRKVRADELGHRPGSQGNDNLTLTDCGSTPADPMASTEPQLGNEATQPQESTSPPSPLATTQGDGQSGVRSPLAKTISGALGTTQGKKP
jgi:hypothetical protein